jgi:hypothetical protein
MELKRKDFLDILRVLKYGLIDRNLLQYQCLYFSGKEIIVANYKMIISYPFKTNFSCFVYADKIIRYIEKIESDDIKISVDGVFFKIESDRKKFKIKTIESNYKFKIGDIDFSNDIPDDFITSLHLMNLSIVNNIGLGTNYINMIHFNNNVVASTDNKRIGMYYLNSDMGNFCLHSTISNILINIDSNIDGFEKYKLEKNCIYLKTLEGFKLKINLIDSKLPDGFEKLLQIPEDVIDIKFGKDVIKDFEICDILNTDFDLYHKTIEMIINKNKIILIKESDLGIFENEILVNKDYEHEIRFEICSEFLVNLIKKEKYEFCYSPSKKTIHYKDEKYIYTAMTRVKND